MRKYNWNDEGHCENPEGMYYKADGIYASYAVAKNKFGWKHSWTIHGSNVTICTPIGWYEEDVCATFKEANELAKFELTKALQLGNFNGRFDGLLMAIGEVVEPKKVIVSEPQLSLF
jgi:hypothetical protein